MGYEIESVKSAEETAMELIIDQNMLEVYKAYEHEFVDAIEFYRGYFNSRTASKEAVVSIIKKLLDMCDLGSGKLYKKITFILIYKIMCISCVRETINKPENRLNRFQDAVNRKIDDVIEKDAEFGRYIEGFFNKF